MYLKYNSDYFYNFSNGVKLTNNDIQKYIDKIVYDLTNRNEKISYSGTGNTMVFGYRCEKDISIYVCKNYEHGELYFENGIWNTVNYSQGEKKYKLDNLSKEQLINKINKLENELEILKNDNREEINIHPEYNPRREI